MVLIRYRTIVVLGILAFAIQGMSVGLASAQALPVRNGRPVLAAVNGAPITLDEFLMQAEPPVDQARLRQGIGTAKDLGLLDRLITVKLIVQEAARMGLDQAPEIRKQVEVMSREILREVLFERLAKDVKPDAAAVDKQYKAAVRESKTTSLLFQAQAAAESARKELAAGVPFKDVAARAVGAKAAKADGDDQYHKKDDYLPQIGAAIAPLQPGQVTEVVKIPAGFVVAKIVDVRYPENAALRAELQKKIAADRQLEALKRHEEALRREYVVVDKAVLKSIDFEAAKPGIDGLLKDKRVVARIKGGASVTVADLTDYLRMQRFHGTDETSQRKRMNEQKEAALDATIGRRVLNAEASRLGIDKTSRYRDRVNGYRESLVFDAFLQKVVAPGAKLREDEIKQYYNAHIKDYSSPQMLRVRGLAFTKRSFAEDALRKLREGADYGWLAANATGRVDPAAAGVLRLDGQPVITSSMPEGLQKALAGSKPKDLRLYASPEGHFYALAVQQVIPSEPKPYGQVRDEVAQKASGLKLKKSLEDYSAKLRAKSPVETFLKKGQ